MPLGAELLAGWGLLSGLEPSGLREWLPSDERGFLAAERATLRLCCASHCLLSDELGLVKRNTRNRVAFANLVRFLPSDFRVATIRETFTHQVASSGVGEATV